MIRRVCLIAGMFVLGTHVSAQESAVPTPIAQELPVEVVLNQHELESDVLSDQHYAQSWLGSVLANHRTRAEDARLAPLRSLLADYRFNEKIEQTLRARLVSDGISPNPELTMLTRLPTKIDAQNQHQVPQLVLVIWPRYSINYSSAQVSVRLVTQIFNRRVEPDGTVRRDERFRHVYTFSFPLGKEGDSNNLARWQSMGKQGLANLLDEGISQVTDMMVEDFSAQGRAEWGYSGKGPSVMLKGWRFEGDIVRQTPDWVWVRTNRMYTQGWEPVSEYSSREVQSMPVLPQLQAPVGGSR